MKKHNLLFLFICLISFTNCAIENKGYLEYINHEITNKKELIENLLSEYEYKNYKIYVIPHTTYGKNPESKISEIEYFKGLSFIPEGPPGVEDQIPPLYNELKESNGKYVRRLVKIQYANDHNNINEINLEYLSYLIIIYELEDEDKNEITNILEEVLLNENRGDKLLLLSK